MTLFVFNRPAALAECVLSPLWKGQRYSRHLFWLFYLFWIILSFFFVCLNKLLGSFCACFISSGPGCTLLRFWADRTVQSRTGNSAGKFKCSLPTDSAGWDRAAVQLFVNMTLKTKGKGSWAAQMEWEKINCGELLHSLRCERNSCIPNVQLGCTAVSSAFLISFFYQNFWFFFFSFLFFPHQIQDL